jgi:hypothetical protein
MLRGGSNGISRVGRGDRKATSRAIDIEIRTIYSEWDSRTKCRPS